MISQDGSHVYFLAQSVLTKTPNAEGESAVAGANNLYVFERDASHPAGSIAFVAQLSSRDLAAWETGLAGSYDNGQEGGDATPDGRFLVFTSNRDLTPDDTSTTRQVFEYDAQTGRWCVYRLARMASTTTAMCPLGTSPTVNLSTARSSQTTTGGEGGYYQPGSYWSHLSVSADGSYVFFQSTVGLTPQALNEAGDRRNRR